MARHALIVQACTNPQQAHCVYIVACADGSLYTGYTVDVEKRVSTHNTGKGARYTRSRRPVQLLASWSFSSRGDALRAEWALKQLSRVQKLRLIDQTVQSIASGVVPTLILAHPSKRPV